MATLPHPLDPRIGVLVCNGLTVFCAYTQGYALDPLIGTLNEVETALGVPLSDPVPAQAALSAPAPATGQDCRSTPSKGSLRRYAVTVTPDVVLYSGTSTFGETVEYVDAGNGRDAKKEVRKRLREVNGRHGPRYTIIAKLDLS